MTGYERHPRLTEEQRRAVRKFGIRVGLGVVAIFIATILYVVFFAKHFTELEKVRQWHM